MNIRPYLIVPKLIPQPTWGGDYIAHFKGIKDPRLLSTKIGQSYELCEETMLTTETDSSKIPIEIADPKTGKTVEVIGDASSMFPLQDLINQDPEAVLGENYLKQYGAKMQILIKFTQAKGNSFQVHVRPGKEIGHWKPKPESWYFFEKGRATLGLKPGVSLEEYKKVCKEIEVFMKAQSQAVQEKKLTIEEAVHASQEFLMTHSPFLFVNVIDIPKESIIDLSAGGIHHSWEEGNDIPNGNIVYEVQLNVMDDDCTLRSFDKGKIANDGSVRPVHVNDYFMALDTDPRSNDPALLLQQRKGTTLFNTPFYSSEINVQEHSIDTTLGTGSFIHRFYLEGTDKVGSSIFIPSTRSV